MKKKKKKKKKKIYIYIYIAKTLTKYLSNTSTYLWIISRQINSLSLASIPAIKNKLAYLFKVFIYIKYNIIYIYYI